MNVGELRKVLEGLPDEMSLVAGVGCEGANLDVKAIVRQARRCRPGAVDQWLVKYPEFEFDGKHSEEEERYIGLGYGDGVPEGPVVDVLYLQEERRE